ncbi:hypothetical protein SAMN05421747_11414 [Parapedobacter composti]|uniref:Glycosyl hydrolases family 43 n=2 Tax=Parapedobacter composti TaxID=623281 RepID=A0A1I1JZZ2_9SPHI|nr:hypothetical protein SAMN05421747_11414 [Parapedobacter composti]
MMTGMFAEPAHGERNPEAAGTMNRRNFLSAAAGFSLLLPQVALGGWRTSPEPRLSAFSKQLRPVGRALESEGYYVWCSSPIFGEDGKVHVFYSRWPADKGMSGWISKSEIAHAVADSPEGPFAYVGTVLAPRPGFWDATTCHNPLIKQVNGKYCLFYMGNSNGKTNTKRIGLATASSLYGPWERGDAPLLESGAPGEWDDHCTTNPAFVEAPDGTCQLFYKSWNTYEYEHSDHPSIRGNRKYGLATAADVHGPYRRHPANPVLDFSSRGGNAQFEDAFVWRENGTYFLIARDMGVYNHEVGLIMESADGIHWSEPLIAYHELAHYVNEPPAPAHLKRYGRLERPMLLMRDGKPAYLFCAAQGGKFSTSSAFVLRYEQK